MDVETLLQPGGWASRFIQHRSWRLARRHNLRPAEAEDVAQDYAAAVVRAWPKYRSDRSRWTTFVARVVESQEASYLRHRGRMKRSGTPLDIDPGEFQRDDADHTSDLKLDVTDVVHGLPPGLQAICQALSKLSVTDAAQSLGIHRSTIYEHIGTIRRRFEDAGLRAYVNSPDTSARDGVSDSRKNCHQSRRCH